MKLIFSSKKDFTPRDRYGIDAHLDELDRKFLDAVDIGEQRDDFNDIRSSFAAVGVVFLGAVEWFAHGEQVVKAVKLAVQHLL